jgi:hypothetical protein
VARGNAGTVLVLRGSVRNGQIKVNHQNLGGQRVEVIENLIFGGKLSVNGNTTALFIGNL